MTEMNETNPSTVLPGQERYVAPLDETPLKAVDSMDESAPASNMWADAWRTLRKNPLFIISGLLIIFIVFVALFPSVLTKQNPNYCTLDNSLEPASSGHPFGFDLQGWRRILPCGLRHPHLAERRRVRHTAGGAARNADRRNRRLLRRMGRRRAERLTDIFLALPILLGAIVVLQMFKTSSSIWKIILVMTLFGWTSVARIARGAVMEAKNLEFNTASTALGSTPIRNLFRHILPNSLAPIIVVGTTSLATYIVLEATLSFLGVGLPTTTVSWGGDISNAQSILRTDPMVLFYPSAALAITVLAFIMMATPSRTRSIRRAVRPECK